MFIRPFTTTQIENIINSLKNKRSYGFDNIPDFLLKKRCAPIIDIFTEIINRFFLSGVEPTTVELKEKIEQTIPLVENWFTLNG
jgi:hypothetical protein